MCDCVGVAVCIGFAGDNLDMKSYSYFKSCFSDNAQNRYI